MFLRRPVKYGIEAAMQIADDWEFGKELGGQLNG